MLYVVPQSCKDVNDNYDGNNMKPVNFFIKKYFTAYQMMRLITLLTRFGGIIMILIEIMIPYLLVVSNREAKSFNVGIFIWAS